MSDTLRTESAAGAFSGDMTARNRINQVPAALGIAAGLAAIWTIAAIARPGATFHLAPILIALAPLLATARESGSSSVVAGAAALIALGTSMALAMADLMRGPGLLPFGGAPTEAVVFAAAAGMAAIGLARLSPRRSA